MLRTIKSHQNGLRLIPGFIANNGTVSIPRYLGNLVSATRTGTGVVEIRIKDRGAKAIACFATAASDGHIANTTTGPTIDGATITTTSGGSASDSSFHFVFAVSDIRNPEVDRRIPRYSVAVSQLASSLLAIKVDTTTPGFTNGLLTERDATIAKNGTGDVTIALRHGLSLPPVVLATSVGSNTKVTVPSATNKEIRVKRTSGGSGADGTVCLFVFGSHSSAQPARARRTLKGPRVKPRLMLITSGGAAADFGSELLAGETISGGQYGLGIFAPKFKTNPVVVATAKGALTSSIQFIGDDYVTLRTHNNGGSQTAGDIAALILAWDSASVASRF